jgi:DNA (cytosine-5)-methyltransferase 1
MDRKQNLNQPCEFHRLSTLLTEQIDALPFSGSDREALVHQWLHAVQFGHQLVGGVEKGRVIEALAAAGYDNFHAEGVRRFIDSIPFPTPPQPKFTFIDLFAGIGGFRLSLQEYGGSCVFSSEWDRAAKTTYLRNYGELPFGDLTQFTQESYNDEQIRSLIPEHDILAAGFPCQPFSHAGVSARTAVGKQHGFACTTQGTLFFDILRVAAARKPRVLFLENVRNIVRHDNGHTFSVIRDAIEELGYSFRHAIIDASTVVPQRRVRCYMVCFRKDLGVDFQYPSFEGQPMALASILESEPDPSYTITSALWEGHQARTQRNVARGTGFTAHLADISQPSNTIVARYGKDGKECLIPQDGKNPRLLTKLECARLQGYPDEFLLADSRTSAYRQLGNSVAIPVVRKIAAAIVENLT